jgi:acetolactate decarboxylase
MDSARGGGPGPADRVASHRRAPERYADAVAHRTTEENAAMPVRRHRHAPWIVAIVLACIGGRVGADAPTVGDPGGDDRITQVSVINALMLGRYDGTVTTRDLLAAGDFGLGTLDRLDGELIVLDGVAWQVRSTGEVVEVPAETTSPFAVITPFGADGEMPCPEVDSLAALDRLLDERVPERNNFVAVRIEADLEAAVLRSVAAQDRPYRPLAEVAKDQSVWRHERLRGTLLGIRSPHWTEGIAVTGYHWHFLSTDREVGGHVLDTRVRAGTIRYDVCGDWTVKLDQSRGFNASDLDTDLREAVRNVESLRDASR